MKPLRLSTIASSALLLLPLAQPLAAQAPAPPPASAPSATNPPATRRAEPARTPAVSQAVQIPPAPPQPVTAAPEKCPLLTTAIDTLEFNFRIAAQLPPTTDGRIPEPRIESNFPYEKTLRYQCFGMNIAASYISSRFVRLEIVLPFSASTWPSMARTFGLPPSPDFTENEYQTVPGEGTNWVSFQRSGSQLQILVSSRKIYATAESATDDEPSPATIDSQLQEIGNMLKSGN